MLEHCPPPTEVPALDPVAREWERARALRGGSEMFRIGICGWGGQLRSCVELFGIEQVEDFTRRMQAFGYRSHIDPREEQMHECDLLLVPEEAEALLH